MHNVELNNYLIICQRLAAVSGVDLSMAERFNHTFNIYKKVTDNPLTVACVVKLLKLDFCDLSWFFSEFNKHAQPTLVSVIWIEADETQTSEIAALELL